MTEGIVNIGFYTSRPVDDIITTAVKASEMAGFEADTTNQREQTVGDNEYLEIEISDGSNWFNLAFNTDEDRSPSEPVLSIGCGQKIYPSGTEQSDYRDQMDSLFELLCRLAVALDIDYAPVFNPVNRDAVPEGRPITESIEELPRLGVYANHIIEQFGGLNAMFDSPPWYTADLASEKTVIIESEWPWLDGGWEPPTSAEFIHDSTFHASETDDNRGLSDPFATLETGALGTDVCVHHGDISPSFSNAELKLVRVYVDENRDLRRLNTDAFVRNVVNDDTGDDAAIIKRMLSDIPLDATSEDMMVSALFHEAIPTAFVRLDDPEGENVVTKIMNLDIETSKHELLIAFGRFAHNDAVDIETIKRTLDDLHGIDAVEGIDDYLRDQLL